MRFLFYTRCAFCSNEFNKGNGARPTTESKMSIYLEMIAEARQTIAETGYSARSQRRRSAEPAKPPRRSAGSARTDEHRRTAPGADNGVDQMITDTYNALLLKGLAAASRDDLLAWGERQGVVFAPGLDPVAVCAALYRTRLRIADSLATSDGVEGEARERYIAAVLEAPHAVVHGKTMSPIDWAAIGREAAR